MYTIMIIGRDLQDPQVLLSYNCLHLLASDNATGGTLYSCSMNIGMALAILQYSVTIVRTCICIVP